MGMKGGERTDKFEMTLIAQQGLGQEEDQTGKKKSILNTSLRLVLHFVINVMRPNMLIQNRLSLQTTGCDSTTEHHLLSAL